jgi:hypothetical protein
VAEAVEPDIQAIDLRTGALSHAEDLIDRLHREAEKHRETLARAIHDDLGGLMVSAAMDLLSVQKHSIGRGAAPKHIGQFWPVRGNEVAFGTSEPGYKRKTYGELSLE